MRYEKSYIIIKPYQFEEMEQANVIKKIKDTKRIEYYVSIYGKLYSKHKSTNRIIEMQPSIDGAGYLKTHIQGKDVRLHVAVLETFMRPRKKGEVVNHLDGNRLNNNLNNLEWVSQSENIKHSHDIKSRKGKSKRGLTIEQAQEIRRLYKEGKTLNGISKEFDCTPTSVKQIVENKTYIF